MAHILFSYLNRIDEAPTSLSGGTWAPSHPLENLKNPRLFKVARSSSTSTSDTILEADFGQNREIRVVALIAHNLSLAAQIKIQLRTAAGGGGNLVAGHPDWSDVWPAMYAGEPERKPTAEELEALPKIYLLVLNQSYDAQYLYIQISDTTNADGHVAIGRLWVGPGWQPMRNYSYGAEIGVLDETPVEESPSGAAFFGIPKKRRSARCSLDWLQMDEGFQKTLDMINSLASTGQLLVCLDPSDCLNKIRQTLLCTMDASPLSLAQLGLTSMSFEFKEVIA